MILQIEALRDLFRRKYSAEKYSGDTFFFRKYLRRHIPRKPVVLNNNDWFSKISCIEFMRDVGKYFRLGPMMAKESVKARLHSPEGMSYTEFSYQLLQAYDFCYLSQHYDIQLQIGGSDQWGNITAGVEFARKLAKPSLYGLTFPLLTRSDGKKFGKTQEGAVWLSPHRLSPYKFYQYLLTTPDNDVIKMMKLLTFMDMKEIQEYENMMKSSNYIPNTAQRKLAEEVRYLFIKRGTGSGNKSNTRSFWRRKIIKRHAAGNSKDLPHVTQSKNSVIGHKYVDIAFQIQLVSSKSEANRLIQNKGAYLNNEKIEDLNYLLKEEDLIDGCIYFLLRVRKINSCMHSIE